MVTDGPTFVFVPAPGAATAAVGGWIRCGSAHEPAAEAGVTHLIEHLLLRRCGRRTPEDIAAAIDGMGGGVDAFTTRELCAVTAHVPAHRLLDATDLVLDALFDPRFRSSEVALERSVVAAEFDMVQDSPGEVVEENALAAAWGDHPLARPVLGERDVVRRLRPRDLSAYHRDHFTADRLLVVVVAPAGESDVERRIARLPRRPWSGSELTAPEWQPRLMVEEREGLEQVYVDLVLPGLPAGHPDALVLSVLNQLLGAGTSSRLFREIRDRRGLAYDIGSSVYGSSVAGVLDVSFSAPVRTASECWDAVLGVLDELSRGAVTDPEVTLARDAIAAGIILGTEGPEALLDAHAGEVLARRRRFDAEILDRELAAVTPERVRDLAARLVRVDMVAGAACGPRGGLHLPAGLARRVA